MNNAIFLPMMAMILLTMVVWFYMYARRLAYLTKQNIDAQELATPERVAATLPEEVNNSANNLKNLFEIPVLFYVLGLIAHGSGLADGLFVNCAWVYVALRAAHSIIQCTANKVMLRFMAYALSCLVLWFMAVRLLLNLA
ncbi:MAG: hypothetical protein ACI9G5_000161 [Paracoccaceae bacterium]|jgi:hypothetical protein